MKARWLLPAVALPLAWAAPALADSLTFKLVDEFSGAVQPTGTLEATFLKVGNDVQLTLTSNLKASEFVSLWYFNFNPNLDIVNVTPPSGVLVDEDNLKADGDGDFDFGFSFGNGVFGEGDGPLVYTISASRELFASDFNFLSEPAGGQGPFKSAAHVQGVYNPNNPEPNNTSGSGWIAAVVPLPPVVLGGSMLMGLVALHRRSRAQV